MVELRDLRYQKVKRTPEEMSMVCTHQKYHS
jgi:hypothetical protein